ncbi:MAG: radical SAM/SPASM domain-containing protein [Anaerolineaceae bacterium]|jgi:radical SAM protein with 4Fe4S-binding SPASM domain
MIQKMIDQKYRFISMFNPKSGAYVRTGIIDKQGRDSGVDPFMASFPHLIDVGIMGHCLHGKTGLCLKAGIGCYQNGFTIEQANMSLEDFVEIARQCKGRVNQIALGGRGDPDQHENFADILEACVENDIVPNFTTSGYGLTDEMAALAKRYCGAVAVSWYRNDYTIRAIETLLDAGIKTNIHYVIGNNSIDEIITRLETDDFPRGINGLVLLLHKPVGLGASSNVLSDDDERVKNLFKLIDRGMHRFKVGMDSCCVPGIINLCRNVIHQTIDPCEGARFSCYISPDMIMLPCSFDQDHRHGVSLQEYSIEQAWNSPAFDAFRLKLKTNCTGCEKRQDCMGGCPLLPEIVLCNEKPIYHKNQGGKQ